MLVNMFNLLFADTSEGEWLDRVVYDFGLDREQATYAERQINTYDGDHEPMDVPLDSRFLIGEISFKLTEKLDTGQYKAVCEQSGTVGNGYNGIILPVDNINGLGTAELVFDPLIPARDTETDEDLRERFYLYVRQSPFGGNIADYERKCMSIDGVGAVKVFGAPDLGPGEVGLVIGDEQGNKATQELIGKVQEMFGQYGLGLAPIGHTVTVKTSTDLAVNVTGSIKLRPGESFDVVKELVEDAVSEYIGGIGFTEETVYYAKLVANMLGASTAIRDVQNVTINGQSANIDLVKTFTNYQVPILGTITLSEVEAP